MKIHLMKLATLVFLISTPYSSIKAQEFLPPLVDANPSTEITDAETGELLSGGNWAFDIVVRNPNPKAVYCKKAPLVGKLDFFRNGCTESGMSTYMLLLTTENGYEIPADGELTFPLVGNNERLDAGAKKGELMQYCGMNPYTPDCGYVCDSSHKYGDQWSETIAGGSLSKVCNRNGEIENLSVTCDLEKYTPDSTNGTCVPRKCGDRAHGAIWSEIAAPGIGTAHYKCEFAVITMTSLQCPSDSTNVGNICMRSCGSTPHGQYITRSIANGTGSWVCDNGSERADHNKFACTFGAAGGGQCPAPNSCQYNGQLIDHGQTRDVGVQCQGACFNVKASCNNGSVSTTKTPAPGRLTPKVSTQRLD